MKNYIIFACSSAILFVFTSRMTNNNLKISFCDVGQGDATLLSIGSTQMLIDAGRPNAKVLECLEHNMPFWDKKIEFFVLTHMDSDHIGGAPQVLSNFDVDFIFVNPSTKETTDFNLFKQALSRKSSHTTQMFHTYVGQNIRIVNGLTAQVIAPQINFPQVISKNTSSTETTLSVANLKNAPEIPAKIEENNLSIALFITFNEITILLPGDLEKEGELAIMSSGLPNNTSILKAGHHGSKTSSIPEFIEGLRPEITVISSGKNNAYNHPNPQVIDIFEQFEIMIYQTKDSGELNFVSDGQAFWEIDESVYW